MQQDGLSGWAVVSGGSLGGGGLVTVQEKDVLAVLPLASSAVSLAVPEETPLGVPLADAMTSLA
jgi:hypothetical protein